MNSHTTSPENRNHLQTDILRPAKFYEIIHFRFCVIVFRSDFRQTHLGILFYGNQMSKKIVYNKIYNFAGNLFFFFVGSHFFVGSQTDKGYKLILPLEHKQHGHICNILL